MRYLEARARPIESSRRSRIARGLTSSEHEQTLAAIPASYQRDQTVRGVTREAVRAADRGELCFPWQIAAAGAQAAVKTGRGE
jgi:hypothetical protein